MYKATDPLPAEVVFALKRSNSTLAITLLQKSTGLSLEDAKAVIDTHLLRTGKPAGRIFSMLGLPFAVSAALRQGNKTEAIRLLREKAGLGLKQAEEAVASLEEKGSEEKGQFSPEKTNESGIGFWFFVALVALAYLGYHFFGGF
jgi:ribosomal protein L7/L12